MLKDKFLLIEKNVKSIQNGASHELDVFFMFLMFKQLQCIKDQGACL